MTFVIRFCSWKLKIGLLLIRGCNLDFSLYKYTYRGWVNRTTTTCLWWTWTKKNHLFRIRHGCTPPCFPRTQTAASLISASKDRHVALRASAIIIASASYLVCWCGSEREKKGYFILLDPYVPLTCSCTMWNRSTIYSSLVTILSPIFLLPHQI